MINNKKYLLREYFSLCNGGICQDLLTEQEKLEVKNGAMILSGIAQRADTLNGNRRIYAYRTLAREVENYKRAIREGRSTGELNHPEESVINLQNVCHKITDIWWEGKDVMVKLKVLSTPNGNILRALVNDGVAIGLSSRGLGTVRETANGLVVEDDFQLICFDAVAEPSTDSAFLHLNESKNYAKMDKTDKIFRSLYDIINK